MEKNIVIKSQKGNYLIHGVLNSKKCTQKLFICTHGLSGSKDSHLPFNSVKYFNSQGFDVFRFDFYSSKDKGRKLEETTIKDHVKDLDQVIKHFNDKYLEIYLAGISLGGPVCLLSRMHEYITKLVLWEPSLDLELISKRYKYDKSRNMYYKHESQLKYIGKDMYDELKKIKTLDLLKKVKIPALAIFGTESLWGSMFDEVENIKNANLIVKQVSRASHSFDEEGTDEALYEMTLDFFQRKPKKSD